VFEIRNPHTGQGLRHAGLSFGKEHFECTRMGMFPAVAEAELIYYSFGSVFVVVVFVTWCVT
jgi:hypothetical protein